MVEQERMQKHIGDATGKIAKIVDVPVAIQTVQKIAEIPQMRFLD